MLKCIVVKIWGSKKRKLSQKRELNENRGEIYKFCENREKFIILGKIGEFAMGIIDLKGMDASGFTCLVKLSSRSRVTLEQSGAWDWRTEFASSILVLLISSSFARRLCLLNEMHNVMDALRDCRAVNFDSCNNL